MTATTDGIIPAQGGSGEPKATVYQAPRQSKPWGEETIFAAVDGLYVGKIIRVRMGHSLSCQYHVCKTETISLIMGLADVEFGPDAEHLTSIIFRAGDTIHLPAGVVHKITAKTDIVFAEVSTAHEGWREDVVRLSDAYGREGTCAP